MNETIRIPRPLGTTEKSLAHNKELTPDSKENLYEHVVQHYINQGFQYCQQSYTLEEFCLYIHTDISYINKHIYQQAKVSHTLLTEEGQTDLVQAIQGLIFGGALSDRSRALQHLNVLTTAQGQEYKPFISSEVTRALSTLIASTNNMAQIAKSFMPSADKMIQINQYNNQHQQTNVLTVETALELIEAKGSVPLLSDPEGIENLYLEHNLGDMPEVQANKQHGYDASKEGLNFAKPAEGHIDRRANSMDVDLDSDQI